MRCLLTVLWCCVACGAHAACPPLPDRSGEKAALLEALAEAETFQAGEVANANMWNLWRTAPDATAQELLDAGVQSIRYGDYIRAEDQLGRLVAYCPEYAEGINQLAFVYFLREEDARSLALLEQALELEPKHFGILSGMALIHLRAGRTALGQVYLRRAVALNPWLNERALLDRPVEGDDL